VYNTDTLTFDGSVSTGSLAMTAKFTGAAAVGDLVVFAPRNANVVGMYSTKTQAFDGIIGTF
jgi:hypothetical protein